MERRSCVLVTGAATGIGRATAVHFAERGWFVGLADVDAVGLQALQERLGDERSQAFLLDVGQYEQWQQALSRFHERTGRIDVLVNNAGILISGSFGDSRIDRHHAVVDVNLKGLLNGCHAARPYLARRPGARVINLSSTAALYGQASLATYSSTKFAVRGLTEALSIEWQDEGIRVMDVMPMFVSTGMLAGIRARSFDRLRARLTPEQVAEVVWKAAGFNGRMSKVHWPVGALSAWLVALTTLGLGGAQRALARRIAV